MLYRAGVESSPPLIGSLGLYPAELLAGNGSELSG